MAFEISLIAKNKKKTLKHWKHFGLFNVFLSGGVVMLLIVAKNVLF